MGSDSTMGKRILFHRKRLGLTQDQLAEQLGVTAQAVSKWENNQSCPDVSLLPQLAEIFGITTDELLGVAREDTLERRRESRKEDGADSEVVIDLEHKANDGVWFALFLIAFGLLYLCNHYLGAAWSFWTPNLGWWQLFWPTAILFMGLCWMCRRISVFNAGVTLLGGYFLAQNLGLVKAAFTWPVLLAGMLVLWGVSILIDAVRGKSSRTWRFRKPVRIFKSTHHDQGTRVCRMEHGIMDYAFSFCSSAVRVPAQELRGGRAEVNFGELTVDLRDCTGLARDCVLQAEASFGELMLLVPRRYRVEHTGTQCAGSVDVAGAPLDSPEGILTVHTEVNFGSIQIQYTE